VNKKQIGRSTVLNWIALGISLFVAFFLSPFVVHRLGNVGYGIWTLVNSMIGYMGLLDLGLRGAVTRFVSKYHARGEHEEAGGIVSAALWLRIWIALIIIAICATIAFFATSVIEIPPELQTAARFTILVVGTSFAVTITCGIFSAVLAARNRFDLISGVNICQVLFRTAGTVWLLKSGYGILALALWELFVVVLGNAAVVAMAFRVYSELRIVFRLPTAAVLREIWGFSAYILVINCAAMVIYYTDNLIVGTFVSVGAVTFYTIAGSLFEYTRQMVSALGVSFMPMATNFHARGETDQLRRLLIQGTRATLLIALPMQAALFFRGHTFIGLWVGDAYAEISGRVLQILMIVQVFAIADYTNYNIAGAIGKHKPIAYRMIGEAVCNLILSIVLVQYIGLEGVAWGTVIPGLVVHLVLGPRYICKELDVPLRSFIWQGWIRTALAVVPFALACYVTDRLWSPVNLLQFFTQIAVIFPIFILGVAVAFWNEIAAEVHVGLDWVRRRWGAALALLRKA
jgi:O-antigen/teichoic acid export membrane protein